MNLHWLGSDVLYATWLYGNKFPTKKSKIPYFIGCTLFAKIADRFVWNHCVVSEHLIEELKPLKLKKPFKVLIDPPKDVSNIKRIPHEGFNVLYYLPASNNPKFTEWVYGWDLIVRAMAYFPSVYFQIVDGSQDLADYYSLADCVIRPCRHDGEPRMIMECKQLGIPYYHSKTNPDIEEIIKFIENEVFSKTQNPLRQG